MELTLSLIYYIFWILYIYAVAVVISIVLLDNRNPTKQIAWILCLILLPAVGLFLYLFFGKSYRGHKIVGEKEFIESPLNTNPDFHNEIAKLSNTSLPSYFHQSPRILVKSGNSPIYSNSKFDIFTSGRESFRRIFEDIEKAKEHIHIEFYIIEDDAIGNAFRRLLIRKAQERVKVRVIYDYLGAFRLTDAYKQSLQNEGIEIYPFLPVGLKIGFSKINYRNHRKIVIVDGKVGYTGGVNIADRYVIGNRLGNWRDTVVRIEGEAVEGVQNIFLADWYFVHKKLLTAPKYYPKPIAFASNTSQIVHSGPDTDWESILQGLLSVINNAKRNIYIHTPYFLPPDSLLIAIEMASLSGVDVRLMLPKKSDTKLASLASGSYFTKLLKAGVNIHLYENNFLHSKAITIDDEVGIVGTANIDIRSFEQNYEINAFIYDSQVAIKLRQAFEIDMQSCALLELKEWLQRGRVRRLKESLARLFTPIL